MDVDNLVDGVWGEYPPDDPRSQLQVYISRLRRCMKEAAGDDRNRIAWHSGYYALDADPASVDLYRFRALRAQARAARDKGDDEQAAALLHDAETLWRGSPLAGLAGDWAARVRKALEEEHLGAIGDRVEVELRLGHHAYLVGEIADLVAQHPFDQTLARHLMIALYRCGRAADALEIYRRTRRRFVEELGTEPGPELRDLHQRMLNEDQDLAIDAATSTPRSRAPRRTTCRGTTHTSPGGHAEIDKLFSWNNSKLAKATVTVVAISGMAGVGKSTLAVHVAHLLSDRYPDRLYLDLHSHDPVEEPVDPMSGLGILLRTLGVPPRTCPGHA